MDGWIAWIGKAAVFRMMEIISLCLWLYSLFAGIYHGEKERGGKSE